MLWGCFAAGGTCALHKIDVIMREENYVDILKQHLKTSVRTVVEKVERFKFLGVHITDKLKWSTHTDSVVKKAQQCHFNLRRLKKLGLSSKTLTNFYRCTIESILPGCNTA
jgi:hypothetical protein